MKKCKDVMTQNPVCCLPTDTVSKAAQMMKDEDVGSIPVVEDEQTMKLIGIVTDRPGAYSLEISVAATTAGGTSSIVERVPVVVK